MKRRKKPPKQVQRKSAESKVDLLSTLSHEVRTPLTSISGYIKLLLDEETGPLIRRQKEYLEIVDKNVDRLTQLIGEILDYQVLASGEIPMTKRILHLGPILKECCDTFNVLASRKGLTLSVHVAAGLRPVFGDRSRLIQIFMNLISNAVKFTQSGSIKVAAIDSRLGIIVTVEDTGIGLSLLEKRNIFKKIFRAASKLPNPESGTGLGLIITKGLVKAHGGKISIMSKKGKGSTVTINFPTALVVTAPGKS